MTWHPKATYSSSLLHCLSGIQKAQSTSASFNPVSPPLPTKKNHFKRSWYHNSYVLQLAWSHRHLISFPWSNTLQQDLLFLCRMGSLLTQTARSPSHMQTHQGSMTSMGQNKNWPSEHDLQDHLAYIPWGGQLLLWGRQQLAQYVKKSRECVSVFTGICQSAACQSCDTKPHGHQHKYFISNVTTGAL